METNNYTNENIARLQTASYPFKVWGKSYIGIASARAAADKLSQETGRDISIEGLHGYTVRPNGSCY